MSSKCTMGLVIRGKCLPSFNAVDPVLWFSKVEEIFEEAKVVNEVEKYLYSTSIMPTNYYILIRRTISEEPKEPYTTMKNTLLEKMSAARMKKLRIIMEEKEYLDGLKPTEILKHIRDFNNDVIPEALLRMIWINLLPAYVDRALSHLKYTKKEDSLDELAILADVIFKNGKEENDKPLDELIGQVADTDAREKLLEMLSNYPYAKQAEDTIADCCWYHWRYGKKHIKRKIPCVTHKLSSATIKMIKNQMKKEAGL